MDNTGQVRGIRHFDYITTAQLSEKLRPLCRDAMLLAAKSKVKKSDILPLNKRKKLYFAGPWFDEQMAMFYDCAERIANYVQPASKYTIFWPRKQKHANPKAVFDNNVKKVKQCDAIIACVNRKDVGTAFELGLAKALGKKIYLLGYDETDMLSHTNVMLAFCGQFLTINNFDKFLVGKMTDNDYVYVDNTWEGKE